MPQELLSAPPGHVAMAPPLDPDFSYRGILLFVAPPGSISEAMIALIEREFSWIAVRQVPDPALACVSFEFTVQLVLVDELLLERFRERWHDLKTVHPHASAGIFAGGHHMARDYLAELIERKAICGVLPMDVNIDVWLSIIKIMLKGGEYFPQALFRGMPRQARSDQLAAEIHAPVRDTRDYWSDTVDELTSRELEVLGMVARGCQNKIIAADLGLSEHTVKIHLHNIISKLAVHNRTEAAAMYLKFANRREASDDFAARGQFGKEDGGSPSA